MGAYKRWLEEEAERLKLDETWTDSAVTVSGLSQASNEGDENGPLVSTANGLVEGPNIHEFTNEVSADGTHSDLWARTDNSTPGDGERENILSLLFQSSTVSEHVADITPEDLYRQMKTRDPKLSIPAWDVPALKENFPSLSSKLRRIPSTRKDVAQLKLDIIAESCGWDQAHQVHLTLQQKILLVVSSLGHGSMGVVEQVQVSPRHTGFVRKRVQLPYHRRKQNLQIAMAEANALKTMDHEHIVKIIGSYQENPPSGLQFYSLLMYPVGDSDLKTYMEILGDEFAQPKDRDASFVSNSVVRSRQLLQKWFSCLASALQYMHDRGIRHQDIKPSNIICRNEDIYFTDFSSSARFDVGSTTSTENPARTSATYAAPEIVDSDGFTLKHGRGTDVFALGCVFSEMLACVYGSGVHSFREHISGNILQRGEVRSSRPVLYGRSIEQIGRYFQSSEFYACVIHDMLAFSRDKRPTARNVNTSIMRYILNDPEWYRQECACSKDSGGGSPAR